MEKPVHLPQLQDGSLWSWGGHPQQCGDGYTGGGLLGRAECAQHHGFAEIKVKFISSA